MIWFYRISAFVIWTIGLAALVVGFVEKDSCKMLWGIASWMISVDADKVADRMERKERE